MYQKREEIAGRKRERERTTSRFTRPSFGVSLLTFSNRCRMQRGNELLAIWSRSFIDISAYSLGWRNIKRRITRSDYIM